ncbi:MAG: N-formylglutamate amidohydrolase [Alphaproteobacteria bacterium]|nr:N-formylglutamate amidohydrolase [Alphaproteobacteria bacterium]
MNTETDIDPVDVIRGSKPAPFLFVCEHASAHIPAGYGRLGLDDAAASSHIAWDPGAETVTRKLGAIFGATAILATVSRLVYDLNRSPDAIDAIPARSEIYDIPGNSNLTPDQVSDRIERLYRPFERTVHNEIERYRDAPALVTIHSFTPVYDGKSRDVQIGFLHDKDSRLADALLSAAPAFTELDVQRNRPYGPEHGVTHTLRIHALPRNLLNVMIEIRSDLLETPDQCDVMATMLGRLLKNALETCNDPLRTAEAGA